MASNDARLGAEFLLAEFDAIQQRTIQMEQSKASSINFYLVIVAATIAAVPSIVDVVPKEATRFFVMAAFTFIFAIGWLTMEHSVDQSINIIRLYRRAGKIRRYFLDQSSDIKAYLPFDANDARPPINVPNTLAHRGAEVTVFAINIASVAIIFAVIFSYISWSWATAVAIVVGGIAWKLQRKYFRRKLERTEESEKWKITFPNTVE